MKKNVILSVIFTFSMVLCNAQSKNQFNDLFKEVFIKYMQSEHKNKITIFDDNRTSLYFQQGQIEDDYEVILFNAENFRKAELKKGIHVVLISPIILENNKILIEIVPVYLSQKKKHHFDISKDMSFTYEYWYSCEKKQWEFVQVKINGG